VAVKGFILALQFLTRLPAPPVSASAEEFVASVRWSPAVGIVIGLILAGAAWLGVRIDPWTGALAVLVAWVAVTGALHIDGLADLADASGAAHKDQERFLAVLADPHVGSFGVVAIAMLLVAKLVLVHGLLESGGGWPVLMLIPFAARIGPLVWMRWLPSLHPGLADRFADAVRPIDLAVWAILLVASAWWVPALLAAPVLIAAWGLWLHRRLGGVSGDCHGAGIELVETGLLIALVVARHV
jgi:adenosylcobinamide-GDP ribazoletransferase